MRENAVRALIVDDDREALRSLAAFLSQSGLSVAVAGSAVEARLIMNSFRPHVLISDLAMPDEDGLELIRSVRRSEKESRRHLGAIAVTGLTEPDVRTRSLEAGFDRYFAKPAIPSAIVGAIREVVAQSATF